MTETRRPSSLVSIFNDVLGPVMRGPSSSHTAGSYRIGRMARSLLGEAPLSARFLFTAGSSLAQTYAAQGADLGFVTGLLKRPVTDNAFAQALDTARARGMHLAFETATQTSDTHPNFVHIELQGQGGRVLTLQARSVGGGLVAITRLQDWPVYLQGKSHDYVFMVDQDHRAALLDEACRIDGLLGPPDCCDRDSGSRLQCQAVKPLSAEAWARLTSLARDQESYAVEPVFHVGCGEPLFTSGAGLCDAARTRSASLGEMGTVYEMTCLARTRAEVRAEMLDRYAVMQQSCSAGLQDDHVDMRLLAPTAGKIFRAQSEKQVAIGGLHTRAAARAMAVMHTCNSRGVVCAAPTGGSAGVIPGVVMSLAEAFDLSEDVIARLLFAAGTIGLIIARRSGFAAEVAGCQVEIGAAGAMAAAAVVEYADGTAEQAADAAAVSLQNTMGLTCDLVQATCEIPCHTRNAVAASSAFVCADLVLGGYHNPIPLDETIDASLAAGKMLPCELRCTARGGLSVAPSALTLTPKRP